MQANIQIITPEYAKQLLETNTDNRRIRRTRVLFYINEMKSGNWMLTPEGITISKTGKLMNGQHRLTALVEAGVSLPFMVFTGVDQEVFKVLDSGMNRTAADIFDISGVKNASVVPAIITAYNNIKQCKSIEGIHKYDKASNSKLLEQYYDNKDFWDKITQKSKNFYNNFQKILQPAIIGSLYAIFCEINTEDADNFFDMLCMGNNLKRGGTIHLLRNKLIEDKVSQRKMNKTIKAALIIKSWNSYRSGKELKCLKFDHIRENYPIAA